MCRFFGARGFWGARFFAPNRPSPHGAQPWDWEFNEIIQDFDSDPSALEAALEKKMQGMNVNDIFYKRTLGPVKATYTVTLLSVAVDMKALQSVTYLIKIGADSHQEVDNDWGRDWDIIEAFRKDECRIWTAEDSAYTARILQERPFNSNQRAILLHGRDSLIARVVRGESTAIAAGYNKGFEAFCYYAEMGRVEQKRPCSLLLAKKNGILWHILKKLADFQIPADLREKMMDLAFFGNGPKVGKGKRTEARTLAGEVHDGELHEAADFVASFFSVP